MKIRVMHVHLIIRNRRNDMKKRAIFSCLVHSDVHGCWGVKDVSLCEILPQNHGEAHYTLIRTPTVYCIFLVGLLSECA